MIGVLIAALTLVGVAPADAGAALKAASGAPGTLKLGRLTLHKCATGPLTYCGGMGVPLDYSSKASPSIHIGFEWLPATAVGRGKHAKGTLLAVEGGPGFSSIGTEGAYAAMLGSLRRTRNLLLIDLRGTRTSTPLDCAGLENFSQVQHQFGPAFNKLVANCGDKLNHTWRYRAGKRPGRFVHASDLFNTAYSARDVSRVLTALRIGRVDLYGDSYGSWFAQVFASRFPGQLRSVTLDSTYQVLGLDPWYTTTVVTARQAFNQACAKSAACRSVAGVHGAWARIGQLARRLTRGPVTGETVSPDGTLTKLTVTVETLVNLVNNAGFDPVVYRDLDAAARALLQHQDQAPLLRLAALSLGFDNSNFPPPEFSDGLYFAVACTDYVQLFSRTASPAIRARQYNRALRREPPGTFSPFTVAQWTELDQYTEAYSACLNWPTPSRLIRPISRRPPLVPPRLHVLILSGTLDSLTPWLDGASLVGSQMGRSARVVRIASLTHVTLQDANDACPAQIFQRFIVNPDGLAHENTSCAGLVSPVHTVGSYPLRLAQAVPARPTKGNQLDRAALQGASTALASVGDEISRWPLLSGDSDRGLRGGHISFSGANVLEISFRDARWTAGAMINGTATWNQATDFVTAQLTVSLVGAKPVRLTAHWRPFGEQNQLAVIAGSQGGRRLAAVTPAP
ncbi:MAG TPA: alpha/beta hydrolase [Streptosporangiaceae bacterium]|nr:alpha/beta hydrolase [Streptosporangiaceae bacterium]